MGVVASVGRWLVLALLFVMVPAFAQQIGVYGGGSIEQGSSRQLTAYVPLVDPAIRWMVNDVEGGNATLVTIGAAGRSTTPTRRPSCRCSSPEHWSRATRRRPASRALAWCSPTAAPACTAISRTMGPEYRA